ncbi:MAG: hypothetical protein J6S54_12345 [Lentisphaeria bacterium]|nr:hypothetical protein [Lentisphaeria bacterium]
MLNENAHKNFTACGDAEAEALLEKVLAEIGTALSGTALSVVLGGSYGRGDGGVRQDKENGVLYNDLDFFVFAREKSESNRPLLKEISQKYEHQLKVDVDFGAVMGISDIKKNAPRLMMQELKRGYRMVCGEDLLEEYLPELPAEEIPFSEACRLLLNRGMGLLLAAEEIAANSGNMDFILRNINKAILGACDAFLIAGNNYKWNILDRLTAVNDSELSDNCKKLYARAVEFKRSPSRELPPDLKAQWCAGRDMFKECMVLICGDDCAGLSRRCGESGEISLMNFIKYCVKSRSLPCRNWRFYTLPGVAVLAKEVFRALEKALEKPVSKSKLYQQWLIFN